MAKGERMEYAENSTKISGIRQRTHERVDNIMDKAESLRNSGSEQMARLKENAAMMRENVDGYIQDNPEKSVLIAAGVGAFIGGMLVAAMMRRNN